MSAARVECTLSIATTGVGASALARRWNDPLLVEVNEHTLSALLDQPDLLEALDPDVPQRLHLLQRPQTFRRSDRPDSLEQARPSSLGSPSRSACL